MAIESLSQIITTLSDEFEVDEDYIYVISELHEHKDSSFYYFIVDKKQVGVFCNEYGLVIFIKYNTHYS